MERKFKIMGVYLGLLFFISILLILITSFSNSKFEPSYEMNGEYQESIFMDDNEKLDTVTKLFVTDKTKEAKTELNKINRENLTPDNQVVYDNLIKKLK